MSIRRVALALAVAVCFSAPGARAEKFDLERSLDLALDASTSVGIAQQNLSSARSGVLRSYGGLMPNFNLSAYGGHSWAGPTTGVVIDEQGRPIAPRGFDYESYSFGMNSQMNLFDWGSTFKGISRSKHTADAAAHDLEYNRDVVKALVIREYYDLVRQRKLREVQESDLEAKKRNLEQVEAFYKIGSRTKADFLQARVDMSNSELLLITRKNAEAIAEARLKSRLNLPQDGPIEIDESIEFSPGEFDMSTEVAFMFEHRSDLLASQQRVEAADANLSAVSKNRYPSLGAQFQYGWNDRQFPDDGAVFKRDYVWALGVFLDWPLFDRFQTKANIQDAKAQRRISEYNLQQSKIDAVLDVKQIMLNLEQATQRLALAEETVAAAQENQRLAEERYRVGAGTILETIQSNSSLVSAQAQLIDARVDYLINRADLQRATGRRITTR
ncbi:MAG TPA: TolC family protein [Candidatus Krumholzibacteria bacterium]